MSGKCDCLRCTLTEMLNERYPAGMNEDDVQDALIGLSDIAGYFLADGDEEFFSAFVAGLRQDRALHRGQDEKPRGRLH